MTTKPLPTAVQRTQRRKRITIRDVEQIARLTECERLNYKEATALLGISYETWRGWKDRAGNEPRYADILARVKAAYLKGRLSNIQDAERGKHGHRPDWRASSRLLEIAAPERYAIQAHPPTVQVMPAMDGRRAAVWTDLAAALHGSEQGHVIDATEVKAITDALPTALPAPPPAAAPPARSRSRKGPPIEPQTPGSV